ncbi:uncharacterized protein LOC114229303 [Eptesicus fuscus]|uniref:uncharacterized protein LOC114229303 n=1 Tax=Eptesicus fuscus TaxID=29078 RepID=UPI002403A3EA|nr:uncharacterized protein LOC114229303 [Eptesicus fuscus]
MEQAAVVPAARECSEDVPVEESSFGRGPVSARSGPSAGTASLSGQLWPRLWFPLGHIRPEGAGASEGPARPAACARQTAQAPPPHPLVLIGRPRQTAAPSARIPFSGLTQPDTGRLGLLSCLSEDVDTLAIAERPSGDTVSRPREPRDVGARRGFPSGACGWPLHPGGQCLVLQVKWMLTAGCPGRVRQDLNPGPCPHCSLCKESAPGSGLVLVAPGLASD